MKRARRQGYVLVEAMAAGAVLGLAMTGLLAGLSYAGGHVGRAQADRVAAHRAQAELERLRNLPTTHAAWALTAPVACPPPAVDPGWTCLIDITQVADGAVSLPAPASLSYPLSYRRARVTLGYRGRQWSLDLLR